MTSFRYHGVYHKPKGSFYMEYELKHDYRVKYALVCARQSFLKEPPKDDFEEYAKKSNHSPLPLLHFSNISCILYPSIKNTLEVKKHHG